MAKARKEDAEEDMGRNAQVKDIYTYGTKNYHIRTR